MDIVRPKSSVRVQTNDLISIITTHFEISNRIILRQNKKECRLSTDTSEIFIVQFNLRSRYPGTLSAYN